MTAVTFVGTGAIGMPMAAKIAEAGFDVVGVDPVPAAVERGREVGLQIVSHISESPKADVVVVMVATPAQLSTLVTDAIEHAAATVVKGVTWIVMSTVGPESVKAEGHRLQDQGARVVDSPVTGGVARAKTASLTLFTSGAESDVAAVLPVLEAMGHSERVGASIGEGQAIKVVNQHLCSVHIVAAAEALELAGRLGLDRERVLHLVEQGAAGSWMLSDRGPRMLLGTDCEVTSSINIFVKDSSMVVDAARGAGADVPLVAEANRRYRVAADELGLGQRDDSRVVETYQPRS